MNLKSTNTEAYQAFLSDLKAARDEKGCTQEELAKRLGKRQSYISKVESGERRLDVGEFAMWAVALEANHADLIENIVRRTTQVSLTPKKRRSIRFPV